MVKLNYLIKLFSFFIVITIKISCNSIEETENNTEENNKQEKVYAIAIKLENGWGYDIFMNNKRYIRQYLIPAVSGTYTFSTKEKALITGNFVVEKINNGIIPPYVRIRELDSLGVLPDEVKKIKLKIEVKKLKN